MNDLFKIASLFVVATIWTACGSTPVVAEKQDTPADTAKAAVIKPVMPQHDTLLDADIRKLYAAYLKVGNALASDGKDEAAKADLNH